MTSPFFNTNTVYVDGHVLPKRVVQSKWSAVVWYRYTSVKYTHKHTLLWTKKRSKKKKSRCSIYIQNSFQMRFIYGPYTPEHTQKRLDLTRASSTPRTEIRPPFPRPFPYGTNRPYQATQLPNHGRSLCRPLSPHYSTYPGNYPQMLSPFWLLLCFILRTPSVTLKRPIMVYNCCNCCFCCNVTNTTVISFRITLKITYQGYWT